MTNTRTMLIGLLAVLSLLLPAATQAQTSEDVVYYVTDNVGSVRMVTDANGAVIAQYDFVPFGANWDPTTVADPRQFAEGERGSALQDGIDYFGARYYQATNGRDGRFLTADDSWFMDPYDPQSMNRYSYALNNPLRYVDPSGHDPDSNPGAHGSDGQCPPEIMGFCLAVTVTAPAPKPVDLQGSIEFVLFGLQSMSGLPSPVPSSTSQSKLTKPQQPGTERARCFANNFEFAEGATNRFFFKGPGRLFRTSAGFVTAGAMARSTGLTTGGMMLQDIVQHVRTYGSLWTWEGVANLGVRGTLTSVAVGSLVNTLAVAGGLEAGIFVGSTIDASYQTFALKSCR